ncbi:hypothetical protein [Massilia endophytica]|uniref:hypothetical protein n=1 Tax=Massilia endophytica TaxID=2899220 RepID=UPI001E55241A|nr:hypothetical protein [Massilia endophytica]UGQ47059.1 hypothetical protein LSQ66_00860 [Massilia endophytica]
MLSFLILEFGSIVVVWLWAITNMDGGLWPFVLVVVSAINIAVAAILTFLHKRFDTSQTHLALYTGAATFVLTAVQSIGAARNLIPSFEAVLPGSLLDIASCDAALPTLYVAICVGYFLLAGSWPRQGSKTDDEHTART